MPLGGRLDEGDFRGRHGLHVEVPHLKINRTYNVVELDLTRAEGEETTPFRRIIPTKLNQTFRSLKEVNNLASAV